MLTSSIIQDPKQRGVLIVDDDPDLCRLVENTLAREGYTMIFRASNGIEALSLLEAHAPTVYLILLDLRMPEMDGLEVVRHLANVHRHPVGIIIVTGYGSFDACREFYHLGTDNVLALNFVSKPIHRQFLIREVAETLDQVHTKRLNQPLAAAGDFHARFDAMEAKLSRVDQEVLSRLEGIDGKLTPMGELPLFYEKLSEVSKKQPSFLEQLGMDVVRAVLIALAFIALLYAGIGDFLAHVLRK